MAEEIANADLIAEAPTLYDLAVASLELLENTFGGPCEDGCECILHDLRASIARVRGEVVTS
jgi:hypothetical protein